MKDIKNEIIGSLFNVTHIYWVPILYIKLFLTPWNIARSRT